MFVGAHALAAIRFKTPELEMGLDEGRMLSKAVENVLRHYDIKTSQKAIDIAALIGAMGMVYGPRAVAISNRLRDERQAGTSGQVIRFPARHRPHQVDPAPSAADQVGDPYGQAYPAVPMGDDLDDGLFS